MGEQSADFSGYATKAGLKCSDGRVITPDAFAHQDGIKVPLVWQHVHNEPTNILGYAVLEHREDGVYTYGFFNDSPHGQSAKTLVQHGDITALSIYANKLVEKGKEVLHGAIREVSLVLSGANPGAFIDNINFAHGDGTEEILDDEAIIYTGLPLEHSDSAPEDKPEEKPAEVKTEEKTVEKTTEVKPADNSEDEPTVQHALDGSTTQQEVYDSFTEEQKALVHYMIGAALEAADTTAAHSGATEGDLAHQEGNTIVNVFEQGKKTEERPTLSHSQLQTIVQDAEKIGSLKESFLAHAQEYGIENIDILFPDAQSVTNTPELISRRMEWVSEVITGTKHSPFSRIKSTAADLTADEARAKGYVKGNKKKDEVIKLLKRVTTPTTIYKKQKLDRDDIVDITDLDVVLWLKGEMRLMLDEELARAVLVGDGREPDDEDKIDEDHLRPIAYDDDMYAHKVTLGTAATPQEIMGAILRARTFYKGTGTPTFFTTDALLTDLLLQEDQIGRRLYDTEQALAAALRVAKIVPVEVMEGHADLIGIIVSLVDYTLGADRGGNVAMFDDFDIDYNQYKYLIETRVSGALTKPKSALVIRRDEGTVVAPTQPSYDSATRTIGIPVAAGVVYTINGAPVNGDVVITNTTDVVAEPASGYSFPHNVDADWTYVVNA